MSDRALPSPQDYTLLNWQERQDLRWQYVRSQDDNCFYCDASLFDEPPDHILIKPINWRSFPENFRQYPIHLQHDHDTNMTEGAVHAYCNAVMWQYEGR